MGRPAPARARWGPPTYPATFTKHDLASAATSSTTDRPERRPAAGFWDIVEVDPPRWLVFVDGFANEDGTPNDDFPRGEGRVTIEPIDAGRTRMQIESRFANTAAMEQVLAMGMEEGLTQAVGQIDAILLEGCPRVTTMTNDNRRARSMCLAPS